MSHEILKAKNEISMVLRGRKSIAPIFFPFLTLGCGQPNAGVAEEGAEHGVAVNTQVCSRQLLICD